MSVERFFTLPILRTASPRARAPSAAPVDNLPGEAIALISGLTIENLDRLFVPLRLPMAGLHGLERRDAGGDLHVLGEVQALERLRVPLANLADSRKGVMLEDKGRALAIHYRKAPHEAEGIRHQVEDLVHSSARDLRVIHGKMVSEVKPLHVDKGSAIHAFMCEAPIVGRVPVFIGDDVTDEDAFAAVNALKGHTIRVGAGLGTVACYRLLDVDQVIEWLESLPSKLRSRHRRYNLEHPRTCRDRPL
jgi:trehalose 6-phosphate phosphatase